MILLIHVGHDASIVLSGVGMRQKNGAGFDLYITYIKYIKPRPMISFYLIKENSFA